MRCAEMALHYGPGFRGTGINSGRLRFFLMEPCVAHALTLERWRSGGHWRGCGRGAGCVLVVMRGT